MSFQNIDTAPSDADLDAEANQNVASSSTSVATTSNDNVSGATIDVFDDDQYRQFLIESLDLLVQSGLADGKAGVGSNSIVFRDTVDAQRQLCAGFDEDERLFVVTGANPDEILRWCFCFLFFSFGHVCLKLISIFSVHWRRNMRQILDSKCRPSVCRSRARHSRRCVRPVRPARCLA